MLDALSHKNIQILHQSMAHSKTDQLNKLFEEWQDRSEENIKQDGINNEILYDKTTPKVLFIMKEPNDPKKGADNYRKWWEKTIEGQFSIRIAEWSYGILNGFPEFDTFNTNRNLKHQAIQQIAFMNVKKVGGMSKANPKTIMEYTRKYLDLIKEEIEIISPDIVILGLLSLKGVSNEIFPDIEWKSSGYGIDIAKYGKAKVINYYHPSATNITSADYYYSLKNIIQSNAFQNL